MNEEIRFTHAIMDYDNEIRYCKMILASGVTVETRKYAEDRLKEAERQKKKLLQNKDKLLGNSH